MQKANKKPQHQAPNVKPRIHPTSTKRETPPKGTKNKMIRSTRRRNQLKLLAMEQRSLQKIPKPESELKKTSRGWETFSKTEKPTTEETDKFPMSHAKLRTARHPATNAT